MEPLTALGVASNVAQFVDFTWKLVTEVRTIHRSATGTSDDVLLLDSILADIEELNGRFEHAPCHTGNLAKLVAQCQKVASELGTVIRTLKADKKNSTWSSFRTALNQVLRKGQLESMTGKLGKIQSQIAQHMLFDLR